jgi:pyridoxine 5-phosphate synthase
MARLAVNVDHVATVRQARGIDEPDPVLAAGLAELAGAEGIICHLREDRRHINDRDLLTTEGGLDVKSQPDHYRKVAKRLAGAGILISFFVDPDPDQIRVSHKCGAHIVEIHTGHYAEARSESEAAERFGRITAAVESAADLNLGISAGHGLNYLNVKRFKGLPQVEEYSIGHSIVARAVLVGFERAVREMIDLVKYF